MNNLPEQSLTDAPNTQPSSSGQNTQASTLALGLTKEDGKTATRSLEQILKRMERLVPDQCPTVTTEAKPPRPLQSQKISSAAELPKEPPLKDDPQGQDQLTDMLAQCYSLLKKYGEKAEQTELRDQGFQWLLGQYPISQIKEAFKKFMLTAREIPVPADILAILDPTTQPLSEAVYIRISRKAPEDRDWQDYEYMRAYENREMRKLK